MLLLEGPFLPLYVAAITLLHTLIFPSVVSIRAGGSECGEQAIQNAIGAPVLQK